MLPTVDRKMEEGSRCNMWLMFPLKPTQISISPWWRKIPWTNLVEVQNMVASKVTCPCMKLNQTLERWWSILIGKFRKRSNVAHPQWWMHTYERSSLMTEKVAPWKSNDGPPYRKKWCHRCGSEHSLTSRKNPHKIWCLRKLEYNLHRMICLLISEIFLLQLL